MDAPFEVAVAGEHRRCDQIAAGDCLGDFTGQRTGIPDTGGAAISNDVESKLGQRLDQARLAADIPSPRASRAPGWS